MLTVIIIITSPVLRLFFREGEKNITIVTLHGTDSDFGTESVKKLKELKGSVPTATGANTYNQEEARSFLQLTLHSQFYSSDMFEHVRNTHQKSSLHTL